MNALTTMRGAMAPTTMQEAMKFAEMLANSTMVPKDYQRNPANVLVAMQWGAELGLAPLQALQNVAVINGRPSIWGDAALALVRGSGLCDGVRENVEGEGEAARAICSVKRRGEDWQERYFTVADAKKAGLWGKTGPWQQYPTRMLQLRARGFALRDIFPDVLRGVITSEEARDIPAEPRDVGRAEVVDQPAAAPVSWPVLAPDGRLLTAKNPQQWVKWAESAVAKLENGTALVHWRDAMEEHFAALDQHDAAAVQQVRDAITDRLDGLASAEDTLDGGAQ